MKRFILLLFFTTAGVCYSQPKNKLDRSKSIQDRIDLSYNEFISGKNKEANKIMKQILHEGYRKKDTTTIGRSYRYLLHYSLEKNPNKKYADSLSKYLYKIDNEYYPSVGLIILGIYNYKIGGESKALDYFLEAQKSAIRVKNSENKEYAEEGILLIKTNWTNDYALKVERKEKSIKDYGDCSSIDCLEAYIELLNIYGDKGDNFKLNATYEKQMNLIKKASLSLREEKLLKLKALGLKSFYNGYYNEAIKTFYAYDSFESGKKDAHLSNHYFIGMSYFKLNKETDAIQHFEKVDSLNLKTNYVYPELSNIYPVLIEYYNDKDAQKQLKYINRYIEVTDRVNELRSKINLKILNEFDKPLLLSQRKKLEDRIALQKQIRTWVFIGAIGSIIALLTILVIYRKQSKKSKKKMFAVIATLRKNQKESVDRTTDVFKMENESRFIADEISQGILIRLKKWEQQGGFLDQTVNQVDLAKTLETNTSYLSKVINIHWNLNFSQYLNHLRIRYIVKELERNKQLQKYTVAALATESGFTNVKSFSKSFKEIMGFNPSSYVQELQGLKS